MKNNIWRNPWFIFIAYLAGIIWLSMILASCHAPEGASSYYYKDYNGGVRKQQAVGCAAYQ